MTNINWPEYQELADAVLRFTGADTDPANKTLEDIFRPDPMSVEDKADLERRMREHQEWAKRQIRERDVQKYFASHGDLRHVSPYSVIRILREERGELEWWEHKNGSTLRRIGIQAAASGLISEKKLQNRIKRFSEASERMHALAEMMEKRLNEETRLRRIQ